MDAHLAAQGQAPPPAAEPAAPPAAPAPEPAAPLAAPVPMDAMDAPADGTGRDTAGTVPTDEDPDGGAARSPESMRSMMSAMQLGWQRGRQDAADAEAAGNEGDQEDDAP
ncbi:hypothetical protein [Actinomadura luteofluorescens]